MEQIREWSFPSALIIAWMLAAAYTASFLFEPQRMQPPPEPPPVETVVAAQ